MIKVEEFDKFIDELTKEGTSTGRKVAIVAELRKDYNESLELKEKQQKDYDHLKETNQLLTDKSIELYRQVGREVYGFKYAGDQGKQKSFSESIKLSDIENSMKIY